MNLLLVEDDRSLGATLRERLERESYHVVWAQDLQRARQAFADNKFDLMIVDVSLPDGSGFDLAQDCGGLRGTPFLFMTALNSAENRLKGFEMGAEEFIPKPFHLKELLLRVRHVLDSHKNRRPVQCGQFVIDLEAMTLTKLAASAPEVVRPAARDFLLLRLLIERSPRVVSRDEILNEIWGEDRFPSTRTIDNSVVRLRQLLDDPQAQHIRSVRGVGYQWVNSDR